MELLEKKIALLKEAMNKSEDEFNVRVALDLPHEISDTNNPTAIERLILVMDDNFPYDEFMYSIIHCIEKFEDEIYLSHLLKTIPEFIYRAPRWASILHMRILNSPQTLFYVLKLM